MKIRETGETGDLGRAIIARLAGRGEQVLMFARRRGGNGDIDWAAATKTGTRLAV